MGASVEHAVWIAIPFTAAVALGIGVVLRRSQLRGDVATGVFFSFSFALGVLFLKLRSSSAPQIQVEHLLFGNMLSVTPTVLHVVVTVAVVACVLTIVLWSRFAYAIFDTARLVGSTIGSATLIALVISTVGAAVGLIASYHLNTPAAATIILIHSAGFAGAFAWSHVRR
jgi:ABC-type Mn2+/Zn2+ transport system permease subunit